METVLVAGATGNIGTAAIQAALRSKFHILAVVRNQDSAEKLFRNVGTKENITTVEADISSELSLRKVIDQVKAGKLPVFQHVISCAGGAYSATPLSKLSVEEMNRSMDISFWTNFSVYIVTVPYLLEQNDPRSTYTVCTGSQGDTAMRAAPAITQGPLYSMATAACRENATTNIRFNEIYLDRRVEVDESALKTGAMKASEFSKAFEAVLARPEIKSCRVFVKTYEDLEDLRFVKKIQDL